MLAAPVMRNSGISLGIQFPGITIISGLLLLLVIFWALREKDWRLGLIALGGGLNLAERLVYGAVLDYWRIPGTQIYNNINDWLIFAGVVLYLWKKLK